MNKLKNFYKENRVFSILMLVIIVCVILMAVIVLKNFVFSNGSNVYGDRLKDEKKYKISDKLQKEISSDLEKDEAIKNATVTIKVRTIYIQINYNSGIDLDSAKSKAVSVLEKFSEDELGYYDIEFILVSEAATDYEGFKIMGAKNVNGSNIVWNNNTPVSK